MRKRLVGTDHHNDERFFDLSRDARYVYGHLLTHPQMTSFGLIRLTVGGLADECGLARDECEAALEQLAGVGRVEADRLCLALDEDYLETPANPSVAAGWGKILDLLPRTELVRRRLGRAVELVKSRARESGEKGSTWSAAIPDSLREILTTPAKPSIPWKAPAARVPPKAAATLAAVAGSPAAGTPRRSRRTRHGRRSSPRPRQGWRSPPTSSPWWTR